MAFLATAQGCTIRQQLLDLNTATLGAEHFLTAHTCVVFSHNILDRCLFLLLLLASEETPCCIHLF